MFTGQNLAWFGALVAVGQLRRLCLSVAARLLLWAAPIVLFVVPFLGDTQGWVDQKSAEIMATWTAVMRPVLEVTPVLPNSPRP